MKALSTEEALGLLSEEVVDGAQEAGFAHHVLLALLAEMDDEGRAIIIPVDHLLAACKEVQLAVRFVPERQVFVLGVEPLLDVDRRGALCAYGWSVEGGQS